MLALALVFSVSWELSHDEPAIEAELWSEIPRGAAPGAAPPPPKLAEPEPVVPPRPPKVVERPEPEPARKPDIVTERTRPKPEEKPRKPAKEVFDATPPKPVKKVETAKDKAEKERQAREAQAASEREALRKANIAKMMSELGGAGGSGLPSSVGAGPSASYAGRIKARIKPNIVFTEQVSGNPLAKVEVRCAPDGRIMARKLTSPSGVAAWDEAVLRAVDRTEVLPADERGKVPPVLLLEFRPNDF